jgi:hypothetical protein
MKALLLGGYGQFGLPTARQLLRYDLIDRVVIAGRNLDRADIAAVQVGPRASALQLDAGDPDTIAQTLDAGDVLISFLWNEAELQGAVMEAAIRAGAHYLNLGHTPPTPEIDAAARAAGVTVLVGVGTSPGLLELMDKRTVAMVDEVDSAVSGWFWPRILDFWTDLYRAYMKLPGDLDRGPHGGELARRLSGPSTAEERLDAIRDDRVVEVWLQRLAARAPQGIEVAAVEGGRRVEVDPWAVGVDIPLDGHPDRFARLPIVAVSAPAPLPFGDGAEQTHHALAGFTRAFTALIREAAERVRSEEVAFADAAASVYAQLAADLDRYLLDPETFSAAALAFLSVYGRKGGRPVRATTWFPQALFTERNFIELTARNARCRLRRRGRLAAARSSRGRDAHGRAPGVP